MAATIRVAGGRPGTQHFAGENAAIITAAESNNLKTSAGRLCRLNVTAVGTTATLDVYDDPAANNNLIWSWVSADGKVSLNLDTPLQAGLRVVTGGTFGRAIVIWT